MGTSISDLNKIQATKKKIKKKSKEKQNQNQNWDGFKNEEKIRKKKIKKRTKTKKQQNPKKTKYSKNIQSKLQNYKPLSDFSSSSQLMDNGIHNSNYNLSQTSGNKNKGKERERERERGKGKKREIGKERQRQRQRQNQKQNQKKNPNKKKKKKEGKETESEMELKNGSKDENTNKNHHRRKNSFLKRTIPKEDSFSKEIENHEWREWKHLIGLPIDLRDLLMTEKIEWERPTRDFTKTGKCIVAKLVKYGNELINFIKMRENQRTFYRNKIKEVRAMSGPDLKNLRSWNIPKPIWKERQELYLNRLLRWKLAYRVEKDCFYILSNKINTINLIFSFQDESLIMFLDHETFCCPITNLFSRSKKIQNLGKIIEKLDSTFFIKRKEYFKHKSAGSKKLARTDKSKLLLKVLFQPNKFGNDIKYHLYDNQLQSQFEKIVLDQRTDEGDRINKLFMMVKKENQSIQPQDIVYFINTMAVHLGTIHLKKSNLEQLPEIITDMQDIIYLYLTRFIFPKIVNFTSQYDTLIHYQTNSKFLEKQLLMRKLDPETFGINESVLLPNVNITSNEIKLDQAISKKRQFGVAIDCLNFLNLITTPFDLLLQIHESMKLIAKEGFYNKLRNKGVSLSEGIKGTDPLGADYILPTMIYVIVHSEIPDIFSCQNLINNFTREKIKITELGYARVTFNAAIQYIDEYVPKKPKVSNSNK
ncbi:tubulin polyglutamylase ttll11 [Anaeramoeba flamelloides]|uniref:Tubulin polyglutamylase ttll11 n=1 Tax=Anaeramoeba flamelloides TaxID=1746091 RepID=A0AAV7YF14_9EUKA|nr:tubulin polyglutamylase ttll11 [Anaeramoeba flamelloides]